MKKVLSVLISVLMIVSACSALSMIVSAGSGHGLTVTKAGAAATDTVDFEWNNGNKLVIKSNGLTVSGTTETEYIETSNGVTDLTIENVTIISQNNIPLNFYSYTGDFTLTVKGINLLDSGDQSMYFDGAGKITGDGNLNMIPAVDCSAVYCSGNLTLDCSGKILADAKSSKGFYSEGSITVTENTGKILAYGNDGDSAFKWNSFSTMTVAKGYTVTGSAKYQEGESEIVSPVTFGAGKIVDANGNAAKSVLISRRISDILATTNFPTSEATGWTDENGAKVFYVPEAKSLFFKLNKNATPILGAESVEKSGDNYVFKMDELFELTFYMKNGVLESLKYEHIDSQIPADFDGTYKPAATAKNNDTSKANTTKGATSPKTGDCTDVMLLFALMTAFVGLVTCTATYKKTEK